MENEVEVRKPVEKGVFMWTAGGVSDRCILKLEMSARIGAFGPWLFFGHQDKSSEECLRREERIDKLGKYLKRHGPVTVKGREFTVSTQILGGPGEQFIKDPAVALRLMPFWWTDVQNFVRGMSDFITGVGGAQLGFAHLSCGGHSVPLLATTVGLSRAIMRPALVMAEMVRPMPDEKPALAIFKEELSYLVRHDYLGFDGLILTDNSCADRFRGLHELDELAAIATVAPLASKPPLSKLHYLECWDLLTRHGPVIGMWGRKIPIRPIGLKKKIMFGMGIGTRWSKDKHSVINSCLSGLESLIKDQSTSLSGLPAREGGYNIFAVVGDISKASFKDIEAEWRSYGLCLYAPARLKNVYITRLANIDEKVLFNDVGLNSDGTKQNHSQEDPYNFDFDEIASHLARRVQIPLDEFNNAWQRKNATSWATISSR